jgi:acyl carrier protein
MAGPDSESVKLLIVSILERQSARVVPAADMADDFNVFAEGMVDSLGFVEMIAELESRLATEIDLGDLDPDDLGVLGPLSRYIAARCGGA